MYITREIFIEDQESRQEVQDFLGLFDLKLPEDIEYTVGIYDKDKLIGVGSLGNSVIKGVAISSDYQGEGILPKIVTYLINISIELGRSNLFVFTTTSAERMFKELGFNRLALGNGDTVLLEWGNGIRDYKAYLDREKEDSQNAAAIVMNANPFTKGHRYLIEEALKDSDFLYIFVVEEDRSEFPFELRKKLVEEGVKDLDRLKVLTTSNYAVSSATFPAYFTKESQLAKVQASLDIDLFARHIASSLDIKKRFVGSEPYSEVTAIYNKVMKEELEAAGIEVVEIERMTSSNKVISASRVREKIRSGQLEGLEELLPKTSCDFLYSDAGKNIINNLNNQGG